MFQLAFAMRMEDLECMTLWKISRAIAACAICAVNAAHAGDARVSFRNDVMAVLSKAGCNAGACHGNANGKAGFKLSLRGESPDLDFLALTHDQLARRVNIVEPEQSLMLLKPTTALAHEGGQRFKKASWEYEILRNWIAQGAINDTASAPALERIEVRPIRQVIVEPTNSVQLHARAIFKNGDQRDLTSIAVYEAS